MVAVDFHLARSRDAIASSPAVSSGQDGGSSSSHMLLYTSLIIFIALLFLFIISAYFVHRFVSRSRLSSKPELPRFALRPFLLRADASKNHSSDDLEETSDSLNSGGNKNISRPTFVMSTCDFLLGDALVRGFSNFIARSPPTHPGGASTGTLQARAEESHAASEITQASQIAESQTSPQTDGRSSNPETDGGNSSDSAGNIPKVAMINLGQGEEQMHASQSSVVPHNDSPTTPCTQHVEKQHSAKVIIPAINTVEVHSDIPSGPPSTTIQAESVTLPLRIKDKAGGTRDHSSVESIQASHPVALSDPHLLALATRPMQNGDHPGHLQSASGLSSTPLVAEELGAVGISVAIDADSTTDSSSSSPGSSDDSFAICNTFCSSSSFSSLSSGCSSEECEKAWEDVEETLAGLGGFVKPDAHSGPPTEADVAKALVSDRSDATDGPANAQVNEGDGGDPATGSPPSPLALPVSSGETYPPFAPSPQRPSGEDGAALHATVPDSSSIGSQLSSYCSSEELRRSWSEADESLETFSKLIDFVTESIRLSGASEVGDVTDDISDNSAVETASDQQLWNGDDGKGGTSAKSFAGGDPTGAKVGGDGIVDSGASNLIKHNKNVPTLDSAFSDSSSVCSDLSSSFSSDSLLNSSGDVETLFSLEKFINAKNIYAKLDGLPKHRDELACGSESDSESESHNLMGAMDDHHGTQSGLDLAASLGAMDLRSLAASSSFVKLLDAARASRNCIVTGTFEPRTATDESKEDGARALLLNRFQIRASPELFRNLPDPVKVSIAHSARSPEGYVPNPDPRTPENLTKDNWRSGEKFKENPHVPMRSSSLSSDRAIIYGQGSPNVRRFSTEPLRWNDIYVRFPDRNSSSELLLEALKRCHEQEVKKGAASLSRAPTSSLFSGGTEVASFDPDATSPYADSRAPTSECHSDAVSPSPNVETPCADSQATATAKDENVSPIVGSDISGSDGSDRARPTAEEVFIATTPPSRATPTLSARSNTVLSRQNTVTPQSARQTLRLQARPRPPSPPRPTSTRKSFSTMPKLDEDVEDIIAAFPPTPTPAAKRPSPPPPPSRPPRSPSRSASRPPLQPVHPPENKAWGADQTPKRQGHPHRGGTVFTPSSKKSSDPSPKQAPVNRPGPRVASTPRRDGSATQSSPAASEDAKRNRRKTAIVGVKLSAHYHTPTAGSAAKRRGTPDVPGDSPRASGRSATSSDARRVSASNAAKRSTAPLK